MIYDATRASLLHPDLQPTLFSDGTTWPIDAMCAECSRLAYIRFEDDDRKKQELSEALARAALGSTRFFSGAAGTQAFASTDAPGSTAFIAFRGTQPDDPSDLGVDAEFMLVDWRGHGKVHLGFRNALEGVWEEIESWLAQVTAKEVWITGHSLGAALATLASELQPTARLVNFGSPRVGDRSFVSAFNGRHVTRYVDCCDLVTELPPQAIGYAHVQGLKYIDRNGVVSAAPSDLTIQEDRAAARLAYLTTKSWRTGNLAVRDLSDHSPINYVSAVLGVRTDS
ncbi:MAG: lipase family protein [Candidatus Accumulibacter sp.]|uniref:lipase family protein n=1 Tax=Accumulibacter sp. TaxID=2053492 RepID=UPI001AD396C7|nr:lipase family protein [Accumulibacter sp.]MBN8439514.1 lipase family protein [Accumulibacter sp.]